MALLYNLARMTTATTGTGTLTLGSAVSGFLSFAGAGVSNGETVTYAIKDGSNSEIGRGVYTSSGTTLSRTVLKSTNSNNAINLSGSAQVVITAAAEDFLIFPASSTDNALVRWDGTGGRTVQNSTAATLDDSGNLTALTHVASVAPSAGWGFSSSTVSSAVTIANSGTYDLGTGSGLLVVGASNGNSVLVYCWFGNTAIIYQDSTHYSTTSGTGSKTNIFYNGGTSAYRIQNNSGGSLDYYIMSLRIRSSS